MTTTMIENDLKDLGYRARWTTYSQGATTVVYDGPNGAELTRTLTDADQEIVFEGFVQTDHCRKCFDPATILLTVYADGRASESKCGRCYL